MRNFRFRQILCWTIVLSILFILTDELMARAGGGGGFRSRGGGGNGGGDGGGLVILIYFLIRLAIQHPVIGVPLLIVVVVLFILGGKKGHSAHVSHTISKTYRKYDTQHTAIAENSLQERDPGFNREAFLERIKNGFSQIQNGWANQDMKPVRHLISDGIYERFSLQFELQKASMIRNEMKDIQILNAEIADIEFDQFFDTIHVRVTASAADYFVKTDNGKTVSGSKYAEKFTEYWSFLRRPGAQTLAKPGLIEGFCPNCGDALNMADCTVCPSCKALINSGEYDWVLTEITQPAEWSQHNRRTVPGLEQLLAKDPAFNIQHIEDKASVMFYRFIAARFFAETNYLVKMASPEYIKSNATMFKALDGGKHEFYADAAIGTVEVVEITNAVENDGMDQVRLKIKWAAHLIKANVPSFMAPRYDSNGIYNSEFILSRLASVTSSTKNILTSAHCPSCGAPESRNTNGACEYCQTPLNDGSSGWVLSKVGRFTGYPDAQTVYHSFETTPERQVSGNLSTFDRESIISCAIGVMLADGKIDENEQQVLMKMGEENGIDNSRLNMLINTVQTEGLDIPAPKNQAEAHEFLRSMVAMCVADGHVSSSERQLIKQLVAQMNYTDMDINLMIKQEMARLHQQVKAYRKNC
jgi:tellurite resistance protein